ncbi:MAG TPA: hypothetical protein VKS21_07780 [Spirochaetota bacterium]|nr:hypothetical protein [Spirochaetota bacterium]
MDLEINNREKKYLRKLAVEQAELASAPVNEQLEKKWYSHNALKGEKPLVVMEIGSFYKDMLPALECENEFARELETMLLTELVNAREIKDDKPVPRYLPVAWDIFIKEYDLEINSTRAVDDQGDDLGYAEEHPVVNLPEDLKLIKKSRYYVDHSQSDRRLNIMRDLFQDILPVKRKNLSLQWYMVLSGKVVKLMGMDRMFMAFMDKPKEMHQLYRKLTDDMIAYLRWQEKEGLLTLNNENDFAGAGSYGFTEELPVSDQKPPLLKDLWGNMNSQETIGISPAMYREFIYPYFAELAACFGLVYYGCCEPVHAIWDDCLENLPNLRKISISPWCNEKIMAEKLKGRAIIYSRKPSPNFLAVGNFDENAFRDYMTESIKIARGLPMEIIFRDIYRLDNDRQKPGRAVAVTKELIDEYWR